MSADRDREDTFERRTDARSGQVCRLHPTRPLVDLARDPLATGGYDTGTQASGEVLVKVPGGWLQDRDTQNYGYFIAPGFSGAPLFSAAAPENLATNRRLIGLAAIMTRRSG